MVLLSRTGYCLTGIARVRRKLAGVEDGERQMVSILGAVLHDGLPDVEATCSQAMREGVCSADCLDSSNQRRR